MRIARGATALLRAVGSEERCNPVVFFNFREAEGSVAAPGSGGAINVGSSIEQGAYGRRLVFMNRVHERSPIVDASALIYVGSGFDQAGDRRGVAIAGSRDERRNGRAGMARGDNQRRDKDSRKLHRRKLTGRTL